METNPFGLFIELISFDQQLIKIENDIRKLEDEIDIYLADLDNIDLQTSQIKESFALTKSNVNDFELQMKELDLQEQDKKTKIDNSQNTKEYSLLKKEIEAIKQKQYNLEPELLEAWKKHDSAKKEFETKKTELETKETLIRKNINEKEELIKSLETQLQELSKQRTEKQQNVPLDWIENYNVMRLRVSNPVVQVQNNSCSACFHHISTQDMIDLKHKKLIQCKRCYRFLYL